MAPFPRLLTIGQVADIFNVTPSAVRAWAKDGKLSPIRTPGGHRRFRREEIEGIIGQSLDPESSDSAA